MNVHAVQYSPVWQDRAANRQRIQTLLHAAPPTPGSLLVLPEMALTGFNLHPSQTLPDWQTDLEFFQHLAREHRCAVIAGGVRPTASPSPTPAENVAWVILPDGEVKATYVKQRPFSLGEEHRVHVAGTASIVVEYGGFRLAPQICYDLRFPELAREATRQGADFLIWIASWPSRRVQHWLTLLQARAIENQAYVLGVNRCGSDPDFSYPGRSVLIDPHGVILADASDAETVLTSRIDPERVMSWRQSFPALRDAGFMTPSSTV